MLPENVLVKIFELTCDPKGKDHVVLSSICRQFRSAVLSQPTFWSHIVNRGSLEWIELCLERSGNELLTIDLHCPRHLDTTQESHRPLNNSDFHLYSSCTCIDFMLQVVEHIHRCYDLKWNHEDPLPDIRSGIFKEQSAKLEALFQRSRSITLPNIRHLTIRKNSLKRPEDGALTDLYRGWSMLNLLTLDVDQSISSLDMTCIGKLEDIVLSVDARGVDPHSHPRDEFNMGDLCSFLRSPAVADVKTMHVCTLGMRDHPAPAGGPPLQHVQLQQLQVLSLDVANPITCEDDSETGNILIYLHTPKLNTLNVTTNYKDHSDVVWMGWLMIEVLQHLEDIFVTVRCDEERFTESVIDGFGARMRMLVSLVRLQGEPRWTVRNTWFVRSAHLDQFEKYVYDDYVVLDMTSLPSITDWMG